MSAPRLLDLFCGAGGAAEGYAQAGFDVVGVDINPQPNYPFDFVQDDALEYLALALEWQRKQFDRGAPLVGLDAIHASPPCQAFTNAQRIQKREHPDLITPLRPLLEATGLPYVIENVEGAPLVSPVLLEGQLFPELRTSRPRIFETNWGLGQPLMPPRPPHTKMGRAPRDGEFMHVVGHFTDADAGRAAMGIDWMTRDELAQAIPPAYTEFIGEQLINHLNKIAA